MGPGSVSTLSVLELEPYADGRVDVVALGGVAVGHAVVDRAVHGTGIGIEALGERIVGVKREGLEIAAAGGGDGAVAARRRADAIAVLMIAVVRRRQIQ
jgi:hypothetical protein